MSKVIDWSDIDTKPREVSWSDVAPASQPYGGKSLEQRQAESKAAADAATVPWYSRYFNGAGVDKAKEMAGQVIAGIPQAVSGIPSTIVAAKDALNKAIGFGTNPPDTAKDWANRSLVPAERMATSIINPVMTPLKQAIELVKPGLVNAPSPDAPETAQAAQGAGAFLGGVMIGKVLGGPAERPIAPLENADPTLLKLEANRLRELAGKPLISSITDLKNPAKLSEIIDRWQAPAKIADLERRAVAIDSRYPVIQGNMTLGPESFAPAEQPPPAQGPSFPPPKAPALGPIGAVRPEAETVTPEKLNVWDQIRGRFGEPPPAAPDAASVNKWMGIRPDEVARGANPGQRILDEKLLGATKDATKANVDSALTSAGKELESKLASATEKGTTIDAQTPVYDAWSKAQKPIGSPKDSAFQSNIQGVVDDIESKYPNLNKLTPTETHSLKVELGDSIDWKNSDNPVNQMMKQIYRDLNASIKDSVEGIGDIQKRWGDLYISSKGLAKGMAKEVVGGGTGSQPGPAVVK